MANMNRAVQKKENDMKRFISGLVVATVTATAAAAGGWSFDIPRLDFPSSAAQASHGCNHLTQTCKL